MQRLQDRVAVVTGGAVNIGRAICRNMAGEGARVWILDIAEEGAAETADLVRSAGGQATVLRTDVTVPAEVEAAVRQILAAEQRVDILVNNVGGSSGADLEDIDEAMLERNIALNLKSAFLCTRAVSRTMLERGAGNVIFVSSVNALLGGFGEVAYSASKAALHSLVKSLTAEYSPRGLRFNALCLGSIPGESATWARRERQHPGTLEDLARLYPLRRVGTADDAALAAVFLASDEASWITGVVLPVDGGISATGALSGGEWWTSLP